MRVRTRPARRGRRRDRLVPDRRDLVRIGHGVIDDLLPDQVEKFFAVEFPGLLKRQCRVLFLQRTQSFGVAAVGYDFETAVQCIQILRRACTDPVNQLRGYTLVAGAKV